MVRVRSVNHEYCSNSQAKAVGWLVGWLRNKSQYKYSAVSGTAMQRTYYVFEPLFD